MAMVKMVKTTGLSIFVLLVVLVLNSCNNNGGIKLGQDIPSQIPETKLSDILEQPATYNGKTVVLNGIISGQCPSLCEFFYKEGAHQVTIFPQGYKFPKLEIGKKVSVYASITSGAENVAVSALGIKTE